MTIEALNGIDLSAGTEPDPQLDERASLEGWLRYQRHEFLRKLRDLSPEQMATWSVPPVEHAPRAGQDPMLRFSALGEVLRS